MRGCVRRRLAPTDLTYEVQVTTDMNTWIDGPNVARELFPRQDDGNGVTETSRMQIFGNLSQAGQRFVRVKVRLE